MNTVDFSSKVNDIKRVGEVIAESLAEMILSAELKPGQQLVQEDIAAMFGVSRIPVRDAFQHLLNMGLIVHIPRRGVIVRPLSKRMILDLFSVREILEGAAIRLVTKNVTDEYIECLENLADRHSTLLQDGKVKLGEKLDGEFHQTVFSISENEVLNNLIYHNWLQIKQARSASRISEQVGKEWIDKSQKRHKNLVEALRLRNDELAYKVVINNIRESKNEVLTSLAALRMLD